MRCLDDGPRDPELTHGFHCPEGPGLGPVQALDQLSFIDDIADSQRNVIAIRAITGSLNRLGAGNFGNHSYCRNGVWELLIDVGTGYRVYYAIAGREIVLLLCGSDKRSQTSDITRACEYRRDFQRRRDDEK